MAAWGNQPSWQQNPSPGPWRPSQPAQPTPAPWQSAQQIHQPHGGQPPQNMVIQPRPQSQSHLVQQPHQGQPRPSVSFHGGPGASMPTPGPSNVPVRPGYGGPSSAAAAPVQEYVVSAGAQDMEDLVVRTLVGDFKLYGDNHGRKVYKKVSESVDVFMYYWDSRDGPTFEGWWFGNEVGGTQVWSLCKNSGMTPPQNGWQIPWDGQVRQSLTVMTKVHAQQMATRQAHMEADMQNKAALEELGSAESAAQVALEQSKALSGDFSSSEDIGQAEALLGPQVLALGQASRKLLDAQKSSKGPAMQEFQKMGSKLRAIGTAINTELSKLRSAKEVAEKHEKERRLEEQDRILFQEIMPEAIQKTNLAEDAVAKAEVTSEMIAGAGDDMEEVRNAVNETEQASRDAQAVIGEARIFLNTKQATCRRFQSDKMKEAAMEEFNNLMQLLQAAQTKLGPLKTVRQDYIQRTAARKLADELVQKLAPAEAEVDNAEAATDELLSGAFDTRDALTTAERAMAKATDQVAAAMNLIEVKMKTVPPGGPALSEVKKLEDRGRGLQERLNQLKVSHKEAHERISSGALTEEASEKLKAVKDAVKKVSDAEGPFLMGVEDLPIDETLTVVKASETAATSASTSVSICRMFLAQKLVEVKRFSPATGAVAQSKLKGYQRELEGLIKKLSDFKAKAAGRKKAVLNREAEDQVAKAEQLANKVAEYASVFEDDTKFNNLSSADIKEASVKAAEAEATANTAIADARKFITARQIETKGKDASEDLSAMLTKYQSRLSDSINEVTRCKKLCASVETRLVAKKHVEEAASKVTAAENKARDALTLIREFESLSPEAIGEHAHKDAQREAEDVTENAGNLLKSAERFLRSQTRVVTGPAKEQIDKFFPKLRIMQEKLDSAMTEMRAKLDEVAVQGIIGEAKARLEEAEASVKQVIAAERPFKLAKKELSSDEASAAIEKLESELQSSHTTLGSTKTFLAMKRLAAKRLVDSVAKTTVEHLGTLQDRLDKAVKTVQEIKRGVSQKKAAILERDNATKMTQVQQKIEAASKATQVLENKDKLDSDTMKQACQKAGKAQAEAQQFVEDTRNLLLTRQKTLKEKESESSPALVVIWSQLEKIANLQKDLNKEKTLLRDCEHSFVGNRLLKDASDRVEQLEKKVAATVAACAPLISDDKEVVNAGIYLQHIIDAMKVSMQTDEKTVQDLFAAMSVDGAITEEKFLSFVKTLPDLMESGELIFTEEQLKSVYNRMDTSGEGKVAEQDFINQVVNRYICINSSSMTEHLSVKGGKTIRKVEVNEVFAAMEEPDKDPALGLMRVKVKADKDGKEGYVTLAGNQGTKYLEMHTPLEAASQKLDGTIRELQDEQVRTVKHIDTKIQELDSVRSGPLAETKTLLANLKPKLYEVQYTLKETKRKVADSKKHQAEFMEVEKVHRQQNAEKRAAEKIAKAATDLHSSLSERVDNIVSTTQSLIGAAASEGNAMTAMNEAEADAHGTLEDLGAGLAKLKELFDSCKSSKGPLSTVLTHLMRTKVAIAAFEGKCKLQVSILAEARRRLVVEASDTVLQFFRTHARTKGLSAAALFKELRGKDGMVSMESVQKFLEKVPDSGLTKEQLQLGLSAYKGGFSILNLQGIVQEYLRCSKEIAITSMLAVKDGKTLRKLDRFEVVEVLEHATEDQGTEGAKMQRIKCRAVLDQIVGWVTLKGNQGTAFLQKCSKPFYYCEDEVHLQSAFESSSDLLRTISPGAVLEVLEGPRQEPALENERLKVKAHKDGKIGWLTSKDADGSKMLEPVKMLQCVGSIAMTTLFDMGESKPIRKVEIGETLDLLEGPKEDTVRNMLRIKCKAKKDQKEGWITMRGNQGTAYIEETEKFNTVKVSTTLDRFFNTGKESLRPLEIGEMVEITEPPKIERKDGPHRVRVRTVGNDALEGWFSSMTANKKTEVHEWSTSFKCVMRCAVQDGLVSSSANELCSLDINDRLEAMEAPKKLDGCVRMKVRVQKDGSVGYATVKEMRQNKVLTFLETDVS